MGSINIVLGTKSFIEFWLPHVKLEYTCFTYTHVLNMKHEIRTKYVGYTIKSWNIFSPWPFTIQLTDDKMPSSQFQPPWVVNLSLRIWSSMLWPDLQHSRAPWIKINCFPFAETSTREEYASGTISTRGEGWDKGQGTLPRPLWPYVTDLNSFIQELYKEKH